MGPAPVLRGVTSPGRRAHPSGCAGPSPAPYNALMPDELLQTILDHPADDTVRLVYADFLEEQGQAERGEFIRVQLRLHQLAAPWPGGMAKAGYLASEVEELRGRERELLIAGEQQWIAEAFGGMIHATPEWPDAIQGWEFRRGFVGKIFCSPRCWLAHGREIVRAQPVERVELSDRNPAAIASNISVWWDGPESHNYFCLGPLYSHLTGQPFHANAGNAVGKCYPSDDAARMALSDALLAWAATDLPLPAAAR